MAGDSRHGKGMERLEEEGGDATGEHRRITVDAPDGIGDGEPALAGRTPDLLPAGFGIVSRHARSQNLAEPALQRMEHRRHAA
jgi:hypothetical protein